ncbi:MAG: acyl-CoA mutase large subunit family protein [Candidatus Freyarchaeota archaeon]|nr:methylmalonyl-CoA mutase family protein [Candidatus Freyrarchaeum guaymaensis]
MVDEGDLAEIRAAREKWEKETLNKWVARLPERKKSFKVSSGFDVKHVYTPEDTAKLNYLKDLGFPGEYPFTRGIHATMYRGRLWTMRQFSGFGTAEDTNKRFKYLLSEGETGLSIAFDYPTIMGLDSDHPMSAGEVGKCGVAVSTLRDMEILFEGIPLDKVTTSMTINMPASVLLAMYIAVGEKQGVPMEALGGTTQNDNLKEFIAQKLCIFPPEPALKLSVDLIEFCAKHMPKWNPISISGYHIREAGATALQELAFTIADGITYVESTLERGLDVDEFAPRLSFFFASHNDFFEEIAKFRAARKVWAMLMKERFNAKKERSMWLRMHVQTSGCTLTAQQPLNNIIRVTIQALAAVLGGTQSLHTNSYDEALALPTEEAVRISLRTQQIIAYESGVCNTVDPLGGSYYVEWLTDKMVEETLKYLDRIESMGGVIECIKRGYFQKEIAESARKYQQEVEKEERVIVGVNKYALDEKIKVPILKIGEDVERKQVERLRRVKAERDNVKVEERLSDLRRAAEKGENLVPYILESVKVYASIGEIIGTLKEVYGEHQEVIVF